MVDFWSPKSNQFINALPKLPSWSIKHYYVSLYMSSLTSCTTGCWNRGIRGLVLGMSMWIYQEGLLRFHSKKKIRWCLLTVWQMCSSSLNGLLMSAVLLPVCMCLYSARPFWSGNTALWNQSILLASFSAPAPCGPCWPAGSPVRHHGQERKHRGGGKKKLHFLITWTVSEADHLR